MTMETFVARCHEALPSIVASTIDGCNGRPAGDGSVHEVAQCNQRDRRANHSAPSFALSRHIDSHVTAQMFILVLTVNVSLAGIHVSFALVLKGILRVGIGHGITSFVVGCYVC